MKPQETKTEFIRLRAEGKPYSFIAKALHISKGTCTAWEKELAAEVKALKRDNLEELYSSYGMMKEARIKRLGDTLSRINEALDHVDLSEAAPEKLLDYKLKYAQAMKEEYTPLEGGYTFKGEANPKEIVTALTDLLNRIRSGDITPEQANKESLVLSNLLRAYDTVEVKKKLEVLESILDSRS